MNQFNTHIIGKRANFIKFIGRERLHQTIDAFIYFSLNCTPTNQWISHTINHFGTEQIRFVVE